MKITRRDYRGTHLYEVRVEDRVIASKLQGITTKLGIMDKPGLVPWAARMAAEGFKAKLKDLITSSQDLIPVFSTLYDIDGYKLANAQKESRGDRGTGIHELCEHLLITGVEQGEDMIRAWLIAEEVKGESVDKDTFLAGMGFLQWLDKHQPRVMNIERPLVCVECGYGCTTDLEVELWGDHWTIDIKTSKGTYDSHILQTCAQDHARRMVDSGAFTHAELKARPGKTGILLIGPDVEGGCQLVETSNTLRDFTALKAVLTLHDWRKSL